MPTEDIKLSVLSILDCMASALVHGRRVEIRGFGSFSLQECPPRMGRNPKTGEVLSLPTRYSLRFKPGKELRQRVDRGRFRQPHDSC